MTRWQTEQQIFELLREEAAATGIGDGAELKMDSTWSEVDIDSIDVIEIASAMEDRLEIEIDDAMLRTITGVGDMVQAVITLQERQREVETSN